MERETVENVYGLNPPQYRRFSSWHKIIALLLLLLLVALWLLGYGPYAYLKCVTSEVAPAKVEAPFAIIAPPVVAKPDPAAVIPAEPSPPVATANVELPKIEPTTLASPSVVTPVTAAIPEVLAIKPKPAPEQARARPLAKPAIAKIYFSADKRTLPRDANRQLTKIIGYLKENPRAKVSVSGFHDRTGRQSHNIELAKGRANAVSVALEKAGISRTRILFEKPAQTTGSGKPEEARRVEIKVKP